MLSLNYSAVGSSQMVFSVTEIQPMSHPLPCRHVNFDDSLFLVSVFIASRP
jgi:hypothetical protein